MRGYYTSIVPGITLSIDIAELPRRDQVALLHTLMQRTGLVEAMYTELGWTVEQQKRFDQVWSATTKKFTEGGTK